MRPHGRARISRSKPQAQAVCDRCGFRFAHSTLSWQFDWQGPRLQNLRILVCQGCRDTPQENIRTIILPPDPLPIYNPRPEFFVSADNPLGGLGWDPANQFSLKGPLSDSGTFGTLAGGGGPDAVFFGAQKLLSQSARLSPSSTASGGNSVGINWSAIPGGPSIVTPSSWSIVEFTGIQQSYVIYQAQVLAPVDTSFLGLTSTTLELDGSSNATNWTSLGTATSAGKAGESVTITSTNTTFYPYHRVWVQGDGSHTAAISSIALSAAGASGAQTGSELGA